LDSARYNRIRLGETSQLTVVPACVVEHETEVCGVAVLSRIGVARGRCPSLVSHFSPRGVA